MEEDDDDKEDEGEEEGGEEGDEVEGATVAIVLPWPVYLEHSVRRSHVRAVIQSGGR
jgi:hypothetical protein